MMIPTSFLIQDILKLPLADGMPRKDGCQPVAEITNQLLVERSAAYLNILCKGLPKEIVRLVKKRRRMLKNRKYAFFECKIS